MCFFFFLPECFSATSAVSAASITGHLKTRGFTIVASGADSATGTLKCYAASRSNSEDDDGPDSSASTFLVELLVRDPTGTEPGSPRAGRELALTLRCNPAEELAGFVRRLDLPTLYGNAAEM